MTDATTSSAYDPAWLADELERGTELMRRFVALLPAARLGAIPPGREGFQPIGDWTAHRHLSHCLFYERWSALPELEEAVLGTPRPSERPREADVYDASLPATELLTDLAGVRVRQAELVRRADAGQLERPTRPGGRSLIWSVAHTVQHNYEHVNDIARIALFWDHVASQIERDRA